MPAISLRIVALGTLFLMFSMLTPRPGFAEFTAAKCQAAKLIAAGKLSRCRTTEQAKVVRAQPADPTKCSPKFMATLAKIDQKATDGGIACRYIDNGNGTVSDLDTGFQWEKKNAADMVADVTNPHDVDNGYTWSSSGVAPDGSAFTDFLASLNDCVDDGTDPPSAITGGFAGYCDWRMPSIVELQTILDLTVGFCGGGTGFCLDPVFGPVVSGYWSATTFASLSSHAWALSFAHGGAGDFGVGKEFGSFGVRAVRGGW